MLELFIAISFAVLPMCGDESAENTSCKWDASTQGNGVGDSFIVVDDEVYFVNN